MNLDLPRQYDPQRENPQLRDYFMDIFEKEIKNTGVAYVKISGDYYARQKVAVRAIDDMLNSD